MNEAWNWHVSIIPTHTPSQNAGAGVMEMWSPSAQRLGDSSMLWKGSRNLGWTTNRLPWEPGVNRGKSTGPGVQA